MSGLVLILITGVGLGALYFLVASGLSLIYGLMHVLNFAHGAFLTLSAFIGWQVAQTLGTDSWGSFLASVAVGAVVGAIFATLTELVLIRPLYERHIEQCSSPSASPSPPSRCSKASGAPTRSTSTARAGCARPPRCSVPASRTPTGCS